MNHERLAAIVINRRMLVALVMGFSCGLPLLLTLSVLQAWMKEAGVDLTTIGLMSLVGLPYTLKFFWSPVFDRYALPFLGRRRGWLLVSQLALMASLVWLGFNNPAAHPELLALAAWRYLFSVRPRTSSWMPIDGRICPTGNWVWGPRYTSTAIASACSWPPAEG
jgi:PAT family beta-lactamase induction signal transducer AmpG